MNILIVGGFDLSQSAWSIARGFEALGHEVFHFASRGRMKTHADKDAQNFAGESRTYPPEVLSRCDCENEAEFGDKLSATINDNQIDMLLWWTCKEDKPRGLTTRLRKEYPKLATVFQTQDDPWHAEGHPEYSDEFEYAVTCCVQSLPAYWSRGINAIVLYPPPDLGMCTAARPIESERCDICFAPGHLQTRKAWPTMYADRTAILETLMPIGKVHGYGTWEREAKSLGLGAGWRGWREFERLPNVYASAKIVVNVHLRPDAEGYLNKRQLEAMACGAFVLTDHVAGIDEIFRVGTDLDTWRTLPGLRDKVKYYLENTRERNAIARCGQRRALNEHSNHAFVCKLLNLIDDVG